MTHQACIAAALWRNCLCECRVWAACPPTPLRVVLFPCRPLAGRAGRGHCAPSAPPRPALSATHQAHGVGAWVGCLSGVVVWCRGALPCGGAVCQYLSVSAQRVAVGFWTAVLATGPRRPRVAARCGGPSPEPLSQKCTHMQACPAACPSAVVVVRDCARGGGAREACGRGWRVRTLC
jgi:hypothetical protein